MVVIRAELWKKGNPADKKLLGVAYITNVGGDENNGDYHIDITKCGSETQTWKKSYLAGFPRKRLGVWDLLYRVLKQLVAHRND